VARPQKVDGLEVGQDLEFQKKEWRAEMLGWILMALLLLGALAGLFGGGPISQATAGGEAEALTIDYHRFTRYQSPTQLLITASPNAVSEGTVRLEIEQDYINSFNVQNVLPEPDSVEVMSDTYIYTFTVNEPNQGMEIIFDLESDKIGTIAGNLGVEGGQNIRISHFVYP